MPAELLTVRQVADLLNVDRKTVYRWVWSGHLPSRRLGPNRDVIRIPADALNRYLEGTT